MSERLSRIGAIVAADLRIRFRRPSTVVIFLLLSAMAYFWVPDPKTGMTLIALNNQRALYNSAAIGVGTATLATIFVGLVGFYVVSNAIRRDVSSRCGFVIASTTMRGTEYLFGKFAGNAVFLTTFMAGFMFTSMAMLLVRGEARLEPLVFMWQYALLVPPAIVFVSALAIFFEAVPFLSGKLGDVAYFFLWAASLGIVASIIEKSHGPGLAGYFDFTGFGFLFDTMKHTLNTTHMSIGHTTFDPRDGVFVFRGLTLDRAWILPRLGSAVLPVALVFAARPFFHRFDPARVKTGALRGPRNWLVRISSVAKPFTSALWRLAPRGGQSLVASSIMDSLMTITAMPATLIAAIILAIVSLAAPARTFMPIAIAVAAVLISDISCREKRAGTTGLVFTSPRIKSGFVWWKLMSAGCTAALILFVPVIRLIANRPSAAWYMITAIFFVVAMATLLGVVSGNPKTFLVLFLTFWYVSVNDGGHTPALDFTGASGVATPMVLVAYLAIGVAAVIAAGVFHRSDLRRNW